jgi:hypothetical protein
MIHFAMGGEASRRRRLGLGPEEEEVLGWARLAWAK